MSEAEPAILGERQFSTVRPEWDVAGYAALADQLRLQSLNSHLGSIEAFAGFAETARRLCMKDSAERARANAVRQYQRVMALLSSHPLPEKVRDEIEERLSHLRSTLGFLRGDAVPAKASQLPAVGAAQPDDPDAAEVQPSERLTARETQILKLIAEGNSSRQVALRLGISFRTATCHRYNIMSKLDLHDTSALVRYAIRNGLVRV